MGYLFLAIALMAGCIKGFCGKKISGKVNSLKGVFYINTIRMVLCTVIGFFIVMSGNINGIKVDSYTLLITAVSGIATALFVASWILCVRKGAYVMIDVFLMMGVGVTVVLCKIFFNEAITLYHGIGFLLLLFGSFVMCSYSSNIKGEFTLKSLVMLIVCGLCNGLADFSQKWFIKAIPDGSIAVFNFYTYVFAAFTLMVFFAVTHKFEKSENDGKSFNIFLVICVMAASLFAYSYFKTMAAKDIDSAILYPLSSGSAIVLSALMASTFFGEKITKKCVAGILVTIAALLIMNLQNM